MARQGYLWGNWQTQARSRFSLTREFIDNHRKTLTQAILFQKSMQPLFIHAFFDGRKGHEKQTRGLLRALGGLTSVSINEHIIIPSASSTFKSFGTFIASLLLPRPKDSNTTADIIIGTGRHTHLPMIELKHKKHPGAKIITCMAPEPFLRKYFDLCFIPEHDNVPAGDNIFPTTGPPNTAADRKQHDPDCGLILVGGIDEKSHTWNNRETLHQIQTIISHSPEMTWTISSSPRTPQETVASLMSLAAGEKSVSFYNASDTPAGWIEAQYDNNNIVWVTADSVSMVYEALSAGCRVGILPVHWKRNNNKFARSLAGLERKKYILHYSQWLAGINFPEEQIELDEAFRCANEVLKRWWPQRLQ